MLLAKLTINELINDHNTYIRWLIVLNSISLINKFPGHELPSLDMIKFYKSKNVDIVDLTQFDDETILQSEELKDSLAQIHKLICVIPSLDQNR